MTQQEAFTHWMPLPLSPEQDSKEKSSTQNK